VTSLPRESVGRYLQWRSDHWDAEHLHRHQRRRLDALVRFVARNSPYYAARLTVPRRGAVVDLDALPRMTKAEMMSHFDEINTAQLRGEDLVRFRMEQERSGGNALYAGRFAVGLSSGTSGNKVLTVLSPQERLRYSALLWARSGIPRQIRRPRVLFALRTNNPAFTEVTALGVHLVYVDYFVPLDDLIVRINAEQLNVLAGPPSLLVMLAERATQVHTGIQAVVSYAEELDDSARRHLEQAFNAPVVEIYQGAEGLLAFTCPAGSLHLNEDCTLIELEEAGDTIGSARRAVITDLYRRAQPFLRYELNDLIELHGDTCPCGSAFRRIRRVHGRADSILNLHGRSGGDVLLMPDYVRRAVNEASDLILEYQVVQWDTGELEVRLHLAQGADRPAIESEVRRNLDYWAQRAGGRLGCVHFPDLEPVRDPGSHKLVRVVRRSHR
jgi:putative adenylate-forming enzyme